MSRDMNLLEPDFRDTVLVALLPGCLKRGVEMRPYFTGRTPWEQARIWRQSRTTHEINEAAQELRFLGAPFLSRVLLEVGPQYGEWGTNCLPGQSWHQWGLAVDCFAVKQNGAAEWKGSDPMYRVYREVAESLGLKSLAHIGDAGHVQQPPEEVLETYTWPEIDAAMRQKFGEVESHVS